MERVEEVIVTGTRAPKAVDKIPGAINVVSEEEVSRITESHRRTPPPCSHARCPVIPNLRRQ